MYTDVYAHKETTAMALAEAGNLDRPMIVDGQEYANGLRSLTSKLASGGNETLVPLRGGTG